MEPLKQIKLARILLKIVIFLSVVLGLLIGYWVTTIGHNYAYDVDWFWGTVIGAVLALIFALFPLIANVCFARSGKKSQFVFWFCLAIYALLTFPVGAILAIFIGLGKIAWNETYRDIEQTS